MTQPRPLSNPEKSDDELERILVDLRSWLMRAARSRCSDMDVLEDAVQESLGALWERWNTLRDPERVRAYALVIVTNRLRTVMGRMVRVVEIPLECPGEGEDPSQALVLSEDRRWFDGEIARLPSPYREVLTLRGEGIDAEQVAVRLGLSRERLRRLTYEGTRLLRRRIRHARAVKT